MDRESDAVVGYTVLRKVIRTDLLATIAAANLRFSLLGKLGLLALEFDFVQARPENTHRLFTIFDLRLLILAAYNRVRRNVRDSHSRVGSIHRLPTRPGGRGGIHA